ncbi:MAG: transposase [Hassallia sp. WJT32-NPBG1]|nr:transposase [Hassallia sp. WJT32-NPBG1]
MARLLANCQTGVFLGYASSKGYTLLDRRLYLPQEWVEFEAYAERRRRCGVPEDIEFKTKPTLHRSLVVVISDNIFCKNPFHAAFC